MRIALVVLFLLCGVGTFAESHPPAPGATNTATQPKPSPQNNQNGPYKYKPTPKDYPPIIEISKTPIIQVETTEKTEKRHNYSSPEWWLVYITALLALITGTLAWYTSRLYKVEFDKVFLNGYDRLLRDFMDFKLFLSENEQIEIDKAWNKHCWDNETGEHDPDFPIFLHYVYRKSEDNFFEVRQLALDNINRIMSFAKLR